MNNFVICKDSTGNDLYLGDEVKVIRTTFLPNEDGWGRDIPCTKECQTLKKEYTGTIVYIEKINRFEVEIKGWTTFALCHFDSVIKTLV